MHESSGQREISPEAPTCKFRGKVIPALVTRFLKGAIASEIPVVVFERIYSVGVYERAIVLTRMAPVEAHNSQLYAPFL